MYFNAKGEQNTEATVKAAVNRAKELGIKKVVVASCTGRTAVLLLGSGLEIVCVTHQVGFAKPGEDELPAEMRRRLQENGVAVLTTTHLMASLDRALRFQFQGSIRPRSWPPLCVCSARASRSAPRSAEWPVTQVWSHPEKTWSRSAVRLPAPIRP